jgi:AcrR family transcriptional regulator
MSHGVTSEKKENQSVVTHGDTIYVDTRNVNMYFSSMNKGEQTDGRHQRAEKNREAIVIAMVDLIREAGDVPTPEVIAERAGVSRRTVFRLFDDLEGLRAAVTNYMRQQVVTRFPFPMPGGEGFHERVDILVDHRAKVYEFITPYRRLADSLQRSQPVVAAGLAEGRKALRMHLEWLLGEHIEPHDRERWHALELVTSWAAWTALREDQNCSVVMAKRILRDLVERICVQPPTTVYSIHRVRKKI